MAATRGVATPFVGLRGFAIGSVVLAVSSYATQNCSRVGQAVPGMREQQHVALELQARGGARRGTCRPLHSPESSALYSSPGGDIEFDPSGM